MKAQICEMTSLCAHSLKTIGPGVVALSVSQDSGRKEMVHSNSVIQGEFNMDSMQEDQKGLKVITGTLRQRVCIEKVVWQKPDLTSTAIYRGRKLWSKQPRFHFASWIQSPMELPLVKPNWQRDERGRLSTLFNLKTVLRPTPQVPLPTLFSYTSYHFFQVGFVAI